MPKKARPALVEVSTFYSMTRSAAPFSRQLVGDVGQIPERAPEAVKARHGEHVASREQLQGKVELFAAEPLSSGSGLFEHDDAAGALQCPRCTVKS
jgi:hypothetical protein